jgi:hypothetical protein
MLNKIKNFFKDFNFIRFIFTGIVPESDLPKNDPQPVIDL